MKNLQIFIWKSSYLNIWRGKSYNNETEVIFQDNWNKWQILNHRIDLQFFDTKLWLQYNNLKFLKNYHHFSLRHTHLLPNWDYRYQNVPQVYWIIIIFIITFNFLRSDSYLILFVLLLHFTFCFFFYSGFFTESTKRYKDIWNDLARKSRYE